MACSSRDGGDVQPQSATPAPPPSALFVLGDSLSDVGNAAAARDYLLSGEIDPPTVGLCNPTDPLVTMRRCDDLFFEKSRVTDGPVAVEHLAASSGLAPLRPSLHLLPSRAREGTVYAVASGKPAAQARKISRDRSIGSCSITRRCLRTPSASS